MMVAHASNKSSSNAYICRDLRSHAEMGIQETTSSVAQTEQGCYPLLTFRPLRSM
jgi:hypothetical protein